MMPVVMLVHEIVHLGSIKIEDSAGCAPVLHSQPTASD
jgi:hypothetical protein